MNSYLLGYIKDYHSEVMIGLFLNGLEVVKHRQDGDVNDRPRKMAMDGRRE
ncbi:hypothetical protein KKI24_18475 [bacterium]|nr:hypothetical protein [bacterium]